MKKLIIASKHKQALILREQSRNKELVNVKFMTKDELISELYFKYDKRAIYYLTKKYNLKVPNAVMYLNNLYYISSGSYDSFKLDKLVSIKKELLANNLLITNPLFEYLLKKFEIVFYDDMNTIFDKEIVSKLQAITTVSFVNEVLESYSHDVYAFDNITLEIEYIAADICKRLLTGADINNIKLINVSDDYKAIINRVFYLHKLPINLNKESIYGSVIISDFLSLLGTIPLDEVFTTLTHKYSSSIDIQIINKLINIMNEYTWFDNDVTDIIDLIIYDLKHTSLPEIVKEKAVEVVCLTDVASDDIAYLIGFNTDTMPLVIKDEDYITDSLKPIVGYDTTVTINKLNKDKTIKDINKIPNLTITFKSAGPKGTYYPSSLLDLINVKQIINNQSFNNITYSNIQNKLKYSENMDLYMKYGSVTNELKELYGDYNKTLYGHDSHAFTGINKELIKEKLNNELVLSFTNIDKYMKCEFRYYLDCLLKLAPYEETFATVIGSYFHYILEIMHQDNFEIELATANYFKDKTISPKEQFFLSKLTTELKIIVEIVLEQEKLSNYKELFSEEKLSITKDKDIHVVIKGFIDKIMVYRNTQASYVALIDYKTGNTDINLNNVIHGLNLQLPIYAYLVKNSDKFKNSIITGMYIEQILNSKELKTNKTLKQIKHDNLKLKGFSINDETLLEKFDPTYKDSELIQSMKTTSKGFGHYTKVLSLNQMDNLIELVDKLIDEMIVNILNGSFNINPKLLDDKDVSCAYCPYEDICYKNYNDFNILTKEDYKTFLGGN